MADTRLSDLSAASALSASDLFYVVQTPGSGGLKATGTQLLTLVGTTYVPLAGGTMTGALTLPAGAVGTPSLMFTGAGSNTGMYSTGANNLSFAVNGVRMAYFDAEALLVKDIVTITGSSARFRFGAGGAGDVALQRVGNYRVALYDMLQTLPVSLEIYTLFTNSSNYERLTLTGVAGTSVNLTAETLGTGGDNLDIVLTPAGTGSVKFPGTSSISSAGVLTTGSSAVVNGHLYVGPGASYSLFLTNTGPLVWGSDVGLIRNAAGVVEVNNGTAATYRDLKLRNLLNVEYHQMTEMTAPAAPATNSVRIYAEDNGAGKTRLMALFASGAAQQIAIEP